MELIAQFSPLFYGILSVLALMLVAYPPAL